MDVNFREDDRRIRQDHPAEDFARLSRIALNLLKAETRKQGVLVASAFAATQSRPRHA